VTDMNLSAKSYLDFAGLGELRTRAKNNEESAAREVGRQFEAMFVQMVFKSVREANEPLKSGLMGSSSVDTFEQMYHDELSQVMAQKGVFGLGDWLTDQVTGQTKGTQGIKAYEQAQPPSMPINAPESPKPVALSSRDYILNRGLGNG